MLCSSKWRRGDAELVVVVTLRTDVFVSVEARLRTLSMVLGLVEGPDPGICIDEPIERFLGESKEIRVFSG